MHIIIGLVLAVVLLYYWLLGHWFARVVMVPVCAACLGLIGAFAGPVIHPAEYSLFGMLVGIALAWPASSLPIYWHRRQVRRAIYNLNPNRLDRPTSI